MALQDAQQKQAANVEQQLMDLEKLSATEDARLSDERRKLSLLETEGAQAAAADYQSMAAQSMQAGFGAITQGLGSALGREDFFALYGKVDPNKPKLTGVADATKQNKFSPYNQMPYGVDYFNYG
jgi:hypothetical protein